MMNNTLYIVWNESNELGISIIDEQHRGIVSSINSFHYFIKNGARMEALVPTLKILEQYTTIHFHTEEALMKKAGYEDIKNHILLHKELMRKTLEITQESIGYKDPEAALKFLKDWWLGHINGIDKLYASHLKRTLGIQ